MRLLLRRFLYITIVLVGAGRMCFAVEPPLNIIFDTDMGPDCDDVGALFILHGAVERGEANILATMGCVSADAIAPCLDAINTWFGHPEIPVGMLKDPGFLAGPHYTSEIARRFPHRFPNGADYPDAMQLYRQVLAKQPDRSVVVVAVGPLRNLANLLRSHPDDASRLNGTELVAMKVKKLVVMGGTYAPFANKKEGEWNFKQDTAAAALVCSTWPSPVLFNGEGGSTNSGRRVTYEMPEHNPLTMAYAVYPGVGFAGDRLSWDSIACLVAVRGAEPWYRVVSGGVNTVDEVTGINTWKAGEDRGHSYLILKAPKTAIETALEEMMVAGKGRPSHLTFNTAYYARDGMCRITSKGAADIASGAIKAFDHDDKTAWLDKAASSWIQCQYADGRKYLVSSYAIVCADKQRLPRILELSGSNDGGTSWTVLDTQNDPWINGYTPRSEFKIANASKWNIYRLNVTAANLTEGVLLSTIELNEMIRHRSDVEVSTVTLDKTRLSIATHGRATLNATVGPMETSKREINWFSSDPKVAGVRRIGEQVAMVVGANPGRCCVTATIGNVRQTCEITVAPSILPEGWTYHELSSPPIPGSIAVTDGTYSITGCGHGMTGFWRRVQDQGVFVSRASTGDTEISARLKSVSPNVGGPAYQWDGRPPTATGLMIRESLAEPLSRYLLVQVEASGKLIGRWRDKAGDPDDNQMKELGTVTLPVHLKLVRRGREIQVFTSVDNLSWAEPRMSHVATFDNESRMGLYVCSGNTFSSTTAAFDLVKIGK